MENKTLVTLMVVMTVAGIGECNRSIADVNSAGPKGANAVGLANFISGQRTILSGAGVTVGVLEGSRAGDPDIDDATGDHAKVNLSINPHAVYFRKSATNFNPTPGAGLEIITSVNPVVTSHPTQISGIIIDTAPATIGIARNATLISSGYDDFGQSSEVTYMHTAQFLATQQRPQPLANHRAIVSAIGYPLMNGQGLYLDGNSQGSLFLDWSSSAHNTLYVTAAAEVGRPQFAWPLDHFNGLNVASSVKDGNDVFRYIDPDNRYDGDDPLYRTTVDLIAPGDDLTIGDIGNIDRMDQAGTSFAAPHVVGAAALLQEFAQAKVAASAPRWMGTTPLGNKVGYRHEVIKAVLMNSADKFIDNGTVANPFSPGVIAKGRLLGMDRTVSYEPPLPNDPEYDWFDSEAFQFDDTPLDTYMGTGHLNVGRAVQQYRSGEYDSGVTNAPVIGWDYGTSGGVGTDRKYAFAQNLIAGSFVSVTLAWDRKVIFEDDLGTMGVYDPNDTFEPWTVQGSGGVIADEQITDLDVYFLPAGSTNTNQAIAKSTNKFGTIDHIFAQVPSTGRYEIWVRQFDADVGNQDYAIAWWGVTAEGDFSGDGVWNATDVNGLTAAIASGTQNLAFDVNKDGLLNINDVIDPDKGWLTAAGAINTDITSGAAFHIGDANLDGVVDGQDFVIWNTNKFTATSDWTRADFNADGFVDGQDFIIWNTNKFKDSLTFVPETSCLVLNIALFVSLLFLRDRPTRFTGSARNDG